MYSGAHQLPGTHMQVCTAVWITKCINANALMHLQVFIGTLRHRIQPVELHAVRNHVFGVKANQHFKCCCPEWQVEEFDFPLPSVKMIRISF